MIRKPRCWETAWDDDPGAGLVNLVDVWVAFSMALLLALIGYLSHSSVPNPGDGPQPTPQQVLEQFRDPKRVPRFRPTDASLNGEGTRLGVAYQLRNGEVVYVPDSSSMSGAAR
jgi:hypothetical protein